ncbi:MAG TPA: CU044_5270 family protein [Actinomycetes bacterium]|jgi:hypothetical protein
MDEITMLKVLGDDVPDLNAGTRRLARERLLSEITNQRRHIVRPGRFMVRPAAVGAFALALAAVLIVAGQEAVRHPHSGGRGSPAFPTVQPRVIQVSAVEALTRAAAQARMTDQQVPIPRDDQYIYTKELLVETSNDGSTETFIDENWRSVDGSKPSRISERGRSWTAPPLKSNEGLWPPVRYADLRQLPLDAKRLLIVVRDWPNAPRLDLPMGGGNLDYDLAYDSLLRLLHGWSVMPPGLHSATFEAIGAIPGVVLTRDAVDARGRHGIGISRPGSTLLPHWMLILDPATYDYLGYKIYNQSISLEAYGVVDRIGQRP